MIKFVLSVSNHTMENLTAARVPALLKKGKLFWMDIEKPTTDDFEFLEETLNLHSLALEDCRHITHTPKIEDYDNHIFLILHSFSYIDHKLRVAQLNIFLSENFLVTVHQKPVAAIDVLLDRCNKKPELLSKNSDFLLYLLLDNIVDSYFFSIDSIDDIIDRLEIEIFHNPTQKTVSKLFKLKRDVLHIRKIVVPERELLSTLMRPEVDFVSQETKIYYRDVYDHLLRVSDALDISRDLLSTLLDSYSSMVSNKLNEVMKVLTIIATIMLPLTLITGIYGMNFRFMPEIHTPWGEVFGYTFALLVMLLVGIVMLIYFKKKGWV